MRVAADSHGDNKHDWYVLDDAATTAGAGAGMDDVATGDDGSKSTLDVSTNTNALGASVGADIHHAPQVHKHRGIRPPPALRWRSGQNLKHSTQRLLLLARRPTRLASDYPKLLELVCKLPQRKAVLGLDDDVRRLRCRVSIDQAHGSRHDAAAAHVGEYVRAGEWLVGFNAIARLTRRAGLYGGGAS